MINIHDKKFVPYLSATQIQNRIGQVAAQLNEDYAGKETLFLPILNGAFMFAADLIRELAFAPEIQFVKISTYGNGMTTGQNAKNVFGLEGLAVKGKHILITEDIVDTGFTVDFLIDFLQKYEPASIKIVALLYKPASFKGKTPPHYAAFEIPPAFVVGYGLDYAQRGRELKEIYVLAE